MSDADNRLLPGGTEMPFAEIAAALATGQDPAVRSTPPRTLTATVVAVCAHQRLIHAAEALQRLSRHVAVRVILISEGSDTRPRAFVGEDTVAVPGLAATFVNNAVAALRLSSLPTLVWWRGCSPGMIDDLAALADRMVIDDAEPLGTWRRAVDLFDRTAFSDMRWTRLTRWRALMANFFDIPEVRAAAPRFDRLHIRGSDRMAASLFAEWLVASLDGEGRIHVHYERSARNVFLEEVRLTDPGGEALTIALAQSRTCVLATAGVDGHPGLARTVSLGDQTETHLLMEELRIRVRDPAFERAMMASVARDGMV